MTRKVNITTDASAARINEAVSARIKLYRSQKKMSLDELSRQAGVSKGMLVEIEGCKANPSIALLCRLASAMGVSVADFVDVAAKPAVHLIDAGEIPVLWQGEKGGSARLLAGTSGPDMVELWQWVLYPGETFESAGHPEGTSELLHVSEGSLTLVVSDTTYVINQGNAAVARTDAPHAYINNGAEVAVFTMTVNEKGR
ncbi:XRE family transcriptional regulator [Pantoea sp. MBD-2R]|uniref:helix-turn-helix domain-containing protein n=1 Tax=unclassified Pantoea TaxID=2630326 RepID=UPI0011BDC886|nr:XRE family transcriptional regulator [Pantoea sp. CCBC3-3-1]